MPRTGMLRTLPLVALVAFLVSSGRTAAGAEQVDPARRLARVERQVRERLAPQLGTDERTTARLAEILREAASRRMAAMQAVRAEREALQALVDRKAPAKELETELARLDDAAARVPARRAVFEQTRRVLTPEQQALLVLQMGRHEQGGREGHRGGKPRGGR